MFPWEIIQDINEKAPKIGHQEAYDFKCRIYDNIRYGPQQEVVQMVYFLQ